MTYEHEFPEDIKKRLENSNLIVSAPGAFFFFGEHSVLQGQPALYMPIPLYLYLGVKVKDKGRESLSLDLYTLDPASGDPKVGTIKKYSWETEIRFRKEDIESEISKLLNEEGYSASYEITVVSEIPPKCGLNSSGAFSAAISTAINLIEGRISPYEIESWQTSSLSLLKKNEIFNKIFKLAWKIDELIQSESSGIGPFASLVGSPEGVPIVYFLSEDKKDYYAYYLTEIAGKNVINVFKTCRFALIYSGRQSFTKEALKETKSRIYESSTYLFPFIRELDSKNISSNKLETPLGRLLGLLKSSNNEDYHLLIDNVIEYLRKRIYGVLGGFSLIGISNIREPIGRLIEDMMNVYQSVLSALGVSTEEIEEICYTFRKIGVGAKLTGSGKGGDVVIFSRISDSYKEIDEVFYELIEKRRTPKEVIDDGFDKEMTLMLEKRIYQNQFKRKMPIIAKISQRTVGIDFLYPRDVKL